MVLWTIQFVVKWKWFVGLMCEWGKATIVILIERQFPFFAPFSTAHFSCENPLGEGTFLSVLIEINQIFSRIRKYFSINYLLTAASNCICGFKMHHWYSQWKVDNNDWIKVKIEAKKFIIRHCAPWHSFYEHLKCIFSPKIGSCQKVTRLYSSIFSPLPALEIKADHHKFNQVTFSRLEIQPSSIMSILYSLGSWLQNFQPLIWKL